MSSSLLNTDNNFFTDGTEILDDKPKNYRFICKGTLNAENDCMYRKVIKSRNELKKCPKCGENQFFDIALTEREV